MTLGLMGRKIGMTRIFTEDGESIPVSVVEVAPNRISQIKSTETDGYEAIQFTAGLKKASKVNKAQAGHCAKAQVEAGDIFAEFRIESAEKYQAGQSISVEELFNAGDFVDVSGISKGKGFAGAVKRHNFRTQDATHGNSLSHRAPGSIGQNQTPGRVFKGKKMAGHLGNKNVTTQNLQLVRVDGEKNLLLIKGAIPGHCGTKICVKPAIKRKEGGK